MESIFQAFSLHSKKRNEKLDIFIIDLNHSKKISDAYGHNTGDELLQAISFILRKMILLQGGEAMNI